MKGTESGTLQDAMWSMNASPAATFLAWDALMGHIAMEIDPDGLGAEWLRDIERRGRDAACRPLERSIQRRFDRICHGRST